MAVGRLDSRTGLVADSAQRADSARATRTMGNPMRHVAKLMVVSAFTALMSTTAAFAQTPKDTIVMAKQIDDIITLDPAEAFEFSGVEVGANVYDKLINIDISKNNELIPDLAESWTVSPDNLTYTFKLRKGVKFHSGNPMTAADVVYSFQRAVTLNKSPGFILRQFGFVAENVLDKVKAVDENTVQITVSKPYAPTFFYNCLTSGVAAIVDSKLVKANEKDGDWGNGWLKLNSAGRRASASSYAMSPSRPRSACSSRRATSTSPATSRRTSSQRSRTTRTSRSSRATRAISSIWA